ncbi:MAG: hypothetical protein R6V12_05865, partial [Candidatus Hydrogenedentota bacterium]
MSEETDDILQRLESIVQSWSSEVSAAQRRLGEQLSETRDRLRSSPDSESETLAADMVEQLVGMQRMLEDCTDAVRQALTRVDALETEVALLKGEMQPEQAPFEMAPAPEESPPESVEPPVEEALVEALPVEEAAAQEPAAEEPAVEEPAVEEPVVEEPAVEEPVVEEPAPEEAAPEERTRR